MITNLELIKFAKSKLGTPYVYGMKGEVMTSAKYAILKNLYKDLVWDSDIRKVNKVCVDCSGLISWATHKIRGSSQFKEMAKEVHPISTISKAPLGVAVWRQGHIGIYIGNGEYIAADGSAYGVRINKLSKTNFTHWFEIADIEYLEDEEMVENSKIIIDGKEVAIRRILKDGTNYIAIRDIANAVGYGITNKGSIAVLYKK